MIYEMFFHEEIPEIFSLSSYLDLSTSNLKRATLQLHNLIYDQIC